MQLILRGKIAERCGMSRKQLLWLNNSCNRQIYKTVNFTEYQEAFAILIANVGKTGHDTKKEKKKT